MPPTAKRRFQARRAIIAATGAAALTAVAAVPVQAASAGENERDTAQACAMEALPIPEGFVSTKVAGMSDLGRQFTKWPDPPAKG